MIKNQQKYTVAGILILALASCSKSDVKTENSGGGGGTTTDTTATIVPQKDPAIAKTEGFFLDDWTAKTFTAPAYVAATPPSGIATVTVNVDYSNVITKVPKYLFGNNTNPYMGQLVSDPDLISSIKNLSPNVLRFPGGSLSDIYFWDGNVPTDIPAKLYNTSGDTTAASYWYGNNTQGWTLSLDNYYAALQQTNSTGMITINYAYARYGTGPHPVATAAHLAANWVRYDKGRTKFWEIGNEDAGAWEAGYKIDITQNKDNQPQIITGGIYGSHFQVFADSMRAAAAQVGAQIEIGGQLIQTAATTSTSAVNQTWNSGFLTSSNGTADFYIVHDYFTGQDNENAATILATPQLETSTVMNYMGTTTQQNNAPLKPIALTEWNIFATGSKQMTSYIAGIHATMVLGELLKNQFGEASRWDLANGWNSGDDQGMFNQGDEPDGVNKWNPRPAFYYMYYFQKYFGDRMVGSTVSGSSDVFSYASSFGSGQAGVVLVNRGTSSQIVSINIKNFAAGTRYYYYTLTGGTDNGEFSGKVYVNGNGPTGANGGPAGYLTLGASSTTIQSGIKISAPPRSVIYLVAESK